MRRGLPFPQIKAQLIDSGRARYVAMHFPLDAHPHAMTAGQAAECGGRQGRFWQMRERLFAHQGLLAARHVVGHAQALALDLPSFQQCMDRSDVAATVRADHGIGEGLGVSATPAFLLGIVTDDGSVELKRRFNGTVPFEAFNTELDALLPQWTARSRIMLRTLSEGRE